MGTMGRSVCLITEILLLKSQAIGLIGYFSCQGRRCREEVP